VALTVKHRVNSVASGAIHDSVSRAVEFLLRSQDDDGWWHDFDIARDSDAWVTGYVASALASTNRTAATRAAIDGWCALRRRTWLGGGWGYNAGVPLDADSTTWALRAAQELKIRCSVRVRRARRFLETHRKGDGGIATYRDRSAIQQFTGLDVSFRGWCASHVCVTAAVAGLVDLADRELTLDYLRTHQRADGSWPSYWWADPAVATALAVDALSMTGRNDDRERTRHAAKWATSRIRDDGCVAPHTASAGSPFVTALVVSTAMRSDDPAAVTPAVRARNWLQRTQRADGSWTASACLRVPPPDIDDPHELETWGTGGVGEASIGNVVSDGGVHTTATVLRALITG
jgi:squalene-hopene/tetraprenyl-beta-curcumene cyclase